MRSENRKRRRRSRDAKFGIDLGEENPHVRAFTKIKPYYPPNQRWKVGAKKSTRSRN